MSKNSKKKKIPNSKIPQIFCWKSGNMSQAPLRLPQRDRRGDARFGTKSRVCNSTDGAPSCIDYQSTTMPTGAHNFKRQLVHTRRAPRGCSQPGEEAGGRRGSVSALLGAAPPCRPPPPQAACIPVGHALSEHDRGCLFWRPSACLCIDSQSRTGYQRLS